MTSIPLSSEILVNTFTTDGQDVASIAMDADGDYVVTWSSSGQDGSDFGIYGQRFDAFGNAVGSEFRVNTFTTGSQDFSSVAMDDDGNFVVTWSSYGGQDGDSGGIYAQRYSANGAVLGSEFRVNTFTTGSQQEVSSAMNGDGNFVVAWESVGQDGDGDGIYAQRYNSAGAVVGSEFRVNTTTVDDQSAAKVAISDNGNFVVTWESDNATDSDIFAQVYNSSGVAIGSEFRVNTFTTDDQDNAAVAMDAEGNFVVTWESEGNAGEDGDGIYAQRFSANGTAIGSEFRVNTTTTGDQSEPSIAMSDDGKFTITWGSDSQTGDTDYGVYAQRYNANGTVNGGEFRVNTFTTDFQGNPAIAMDDDGDFAIAWESYTQDGSADGVYAQSYSLPSEVQFSSATFEVNEDGTPEGTAITLTRAHENLEAEVLVNITGGTATAGADYTGTNFPLTVSFAVGETSKTIVVPIVQDNIQEDTETLTLSLSAVGDTLLGSQSTTTLSILDDEIATPGKDVIKGDAGDDKISGQDGNDKLSGDDGDDKLTGGDGDDVLKGGKGDDTLLGGKGDDKLIGGDGDDVLKGGKDNDVLKGGKGSDRLLGNGGDDVMIGGKSKDIFDGLSKKGFALIKDFDNGSDQLGLSGKVKFGDLDIDQDGKSTILSLNNDIIAELKDVKVNQINAADFV